MREVVIAKPDMLTRKGRSFTASCLAIVEADTLWDGGTISDDTRPVFAMFAGSDQEMRPFQANLRIGKKAHFVSDQRSYRKKTDKIEFLRSAGYQYTWQREAEGSILTVRLPELFEMDPGMVDVWGAKFVMLPTKEWLAAQTIDPKPALDHVKQLGFNRELDPNFVPLASLFAVYLDRRTRCPILMDERFYLQLFIASLTEGLASFPDDGGYGDKFGVRKSFRFWQQTADLPELSEAVAFKASHEQIEKLLAEQTTNFYEATSG
jgi:hypothetical protein